MSFVTDIWKAIDGSKTYILMIANGVLGVYMYMNPEFIMPSWLAAVDVGLFGGALKSAIAKSAPVVK